MLTGQAHEPPLHKPFGILAYAAREGQQINKTDWNGMACVVIGSIWRGAVLMDLHTGRVYKRADVNVIYYPDVFPIRVLILHARRRRMLAAVGYRPDMRDAVRRLGRPHRAGDYLWSPMAPPASLRIPAPREEESPAPESDPPPVSAPREEPSPSTSLAPGLTASALRAAESPAPDLPASAKPALQPLSPALTRSARRLLGRPPPVMPDLGRRPEDHAVRLPEHASLLRLIEASTPEDFRTSGEHIAAYAARTYLTQACTPPPARRTGAP